MPNYTVESATVETPDGVNLWTRIFRPKQVTKDDNNMAIVLVHPYSIMGGCQVLMQGIASGLADKGYPAVTFDMRGVGRSTGKPSLTGFAEVADVVAVCNWVSQNISSHKILLLGSSAGAPIAGSAVDQLEQVVGYVKSGVPFRHDGLDPLWTTPQCHPAIPKTKTLCYGNSGWIYECESAQQQAEICSRTHRKASNPRS